MQFKLPELGEGVHEGELVKWKVKVGESITYDQPLCEIMTDKATVEIPSAVQGKVGQLHVKEGDVVSVGQLMLSFDGAGGSAEAGSSHAGNPSAAQSGTKSAAHPASGHSPVTANPPQNSLANKSAKNGIASSSHSATSHVAPSLNTDIATRALAAPSTRRLAREMGVDLGSVQGSGPHGRIMKADLSGGGAVSSLGTVSAHTARIPTGSHKTGEERVPFIGLRKKISEKMRLSKDHAAHFTYVEEADATELVRLRTQAKDIAAKQGVKMTYLPFVMKAMVSSLRQFPVLNSSLDEERNELVYKHDFNIGLSVQTEDGLTAPVIKDVAHKSILEIARDIQNVVERARSKRLTREDLTGSTITLTNAGSIGGLFATPVINYPEVAILGFNKIFRKPVVRMVQNREEIVIRDWTYFSISLDHRVVDGAVGAEFMKVFISYIENPNLLLLESF